MPKLHNYAFIDSQNLNLGVKTDVIYKNNKVYSGWQLDYLKFRKFLKDKYRVEQAFLFIGNLTGQESLYAYLQRCGYILILKPTTSFKDKKGNITVKGNVDTDLVLYACAKEINNYDKAVIVSGDGDFLSLYEYLEQQNKLYKILVPNKYKYSQLLTKYASYIDFVSPSKLKLAKNNPTKKTSIILQDAHYKVTRHGDSKNISHKAQKLKVKKPKK
jgi:uncharacterized LabA/DUF88 family protein